MNLRKVIFCGFLGYRHSEMCMELPAFEKSKTDDYLSDDDFFRHGLKQKNSRRKNTIFLRPNESFIADKRSELLLVETDYLPPDHTDSEPNNRIDCRDDKAVTPPFRLRYITGTEVHRSRTVAIVRERNR